MISFAPLVLIDEINLTLNCTFATLGIKLYLDIQKYTLFYSCTYQKFLFLTTQCMKGRVMVVC